MSSRRPKPFLRYINVDLEIRSRRDLQPLVDALGEHLVVLHAARHADGSLATFEALDVNPSPDLAIRRFATAVSKLETSMRTL